MLRYFSDPAVPSSDKWFCLEKKEGHVNAEDLLIDTGVLKNVLKKRENDDNFNETLNTLGYGGRAPYVIATPLMLLEVLGLSGDRFNKFAANSPNELGVRKILGGASAEGMEGKFIDAFHFIEDCIRKDPQTTLQGLSDAFQHERNHYNRSEISKYLLDNLLGKNLTDKSYASFVARYAFDVFQGLPLEKYDLDRRAMTRLDSYFLSTIFFSLKDEGTNFACSRYVDNIWQRASGKVSQKPASPYEAGQQMLDTEQTHFAVAGRRHEKGASSVSIITTENLSGWRDRISRYLELIRFVNERAAPKHGSLQLSPGYVYSINPVGKLTGTSIDVGREFNCQL